MPGVERLQPPVAREAARLGIRRRDPGPVGALWSTPGSLTPGSTLWSLLAGFAWGERTLRVRDPAAPFLQAGQWVRFGPGRSLEDTLDPVLDQSPTPLIEVGSANSGTWVLMVAASDDDPADPHVYAVDHDIETMLQDALVHTGLRLSALLARLEPDAECAPDAGATECA